VDEPAPDPRTAARVASIRAACALPVARVHGSLEGRADGEVLAAAIEPDGRHAALVLRDAIERWDLDALACVGRWEVAPPGYVNHAACVAPAPGGLRVLCPDGLWRLKDAGDAWQMLTAIDRADGQVLAWGDVFAVARGGAVQVVRFDDGAPRWAAPLQAAPHDVALSRCGRFGLRRVSSTSFDVLESVAPCAGAPAGLRTVARLATAPPAVHGFQFAALDGERRLAAVATSEGVVVGRWDDWWGAATVPVRAHALAQLEFTEGGRALVLCEPRRVARVDLATHAFTVARGLPRTLGGPGQTPQVSASGRVLCVSHGGLHVLDVGRDDFRTRAFDPVGEVTCAAGTPDGRALVTGADDGSLRVRDRATGEALAQGEAGGPVVAVAASPDGRDVLAVRGTRDLLRFDRATGALVAVVARTRDALWLRAGALATSADGRFAALSSAGASARVDLATGAQQALEAPAGAIRLTPDGAAFTPEGAIRSLYTQSSDARPPELLAIEHATDGAAREVVRRPLTGAGDGDTTDSLHLALSRDGRLLWRIASSRNGTLVSGAPIGAAPRGVDRHLWCAGTRVLAVSISRGELLLLAAHGAGVRTPWPRGCVPLAFAPDDGALWVRDASGLVAEVTLPASLRAPATP